MNEEVPKNIIKRVDENWESNFFPSHFSNEIYYSKSNGFPPFEYQTNLTIKFVHEGYDFYKVNGKEFKINKDQYLILNNGNDVVCYSDSKAEGMSVFIDHTLLNEVNTSIKDSLDFEGNQDEPVQVLEIPHLCNDKLGSFLIDLFYSIRSFDNIDDFTDQESFYYKLAELIASTDHGVRNRIMSINRNDPAVRFELYKRLTWAMEYLEYNYQSNVTLIDLARTACLSKYYLIKVFKMVYGTTPYNYLLSKRIEHAKRLLTKSNESITEISKLMGFNDTAAFSKKFKKAVGFTPSHYRTVQFEESN